MNPEVDAFIEKDERWHDELVLLREIVLDCGLHEEIKWKVPCYTYKSNNVVIIHGFKEYCALNFFKGALLKDSENILIQQTENSQASRQIRFANTKEIVQLKNTIKAYLYEAIEVEKVGLKIDYKDTSAFEVPEELEKAMGENTKLKHAFEALTPGRQRGYLLHFSQPKQAKTREARIQKNLDRIYDGKGLNDCICGLSKRMPSCDGSHKQLKK